jgi:hypothetical protein
MGVPEVLDDLQIGLEARIDFNACSLQSDFNQDWLIVRTHTLPDFAQVLGDFFN